MSTTDNSIVEYLQRIGKGITYSAIGVLKEQMPVTTNFIDTNTSTVRDTVNNITNIKQISDKVSNLTDEYVFKPANKLLQNLREDLRTGEFFHPERQEQSDLEMMKALLGDEMADMLNGDFDIDEEDDTMEAPSVKGIPTVTRGESIIASTVQQTGINSSRSIISANQNLTKAQLEANKAIANMQYAVQEKTIRTLENGFIALTNGINSIIEFNNQAMLVHIENSKQFYDQMTTFTQENNAILKEIIDIQRSIYKGSKKEELDEEGNPIKKPPTAKDIFANGLNLKEYMRYVEGNIDNSPIGVALQFVKFIPAMIQDAITNPLEFVSKQIIDGLMGPKLKTALQRFDTTFSGFFQTALAKLADIGRDKEHGDSIFGMVARLFGFKEQNTKFAIHGDPSKYEKGPVPYNGIANKSLIEVIPGYLARIEAALSGQGERYFNFQTGKWATLKETKRVEKEIDRRLESESLRDIRNTLNDYLSAISFDKKNQDVLQNDKDRREFRQHVLNKITKGIYEKGYISWDDILEDPLGRYGKREIKPEFYNLAYTLLQNLPRELQLALTSNINNAKATKRQIMDDMTGQSQGLHNILLNNGIKGAIDAKPGIQQYVDGTTIGQNIPSDLTLLKDKRGLSLYDYQLRIYRELFLLRTTGMGTRSKRLRNIIPNIYQKIFGTDIDVSLNDLRELLDKDQSGMQASLAQDGRSNSVTEQQKIIDQSNKSFIYKDPTQIEEYDREVKRKESNKRKEEVKYLFKLLQEAGLKEEYNENHEYTGYEIARLKRKLQELNYNKEYNIDQIEINPRRFGSEYDYTQETLHKVNRELGKVRQRNLDNQYYSNTSMLGSFLGRDDQPVEWPEGVDPNAPFLDQMMQAADIGSKMKVITNNIGNLATAPTALLTSAIDAADNFLYDMLYKRRGPVYDDKGRPVEGLFNIMVWEMKQSMTKLNNWMDDAFDQFKSKLDGGAFGKFKSFAKDYLNIDIDSGIDKVKGFIKKGTAPLMAGAIGTVTGGGNVILDALNGTLRDLGLDIQLGRNGVKPLPKVTVKQNPTKDKPFTYNEETDEVTRHVYDKDGKLLAKHIIRRDEKGNIVEYLDTGEKDKDGNSKLKKLYEGKEVEDAFSQAKKDYKKQKRALQDDVILEERIRESLMTPTNDNLTTYNKETGVLETYKQNSEGQLYKVSSMYKDNEGNIVENYYNEKESKWENRKAKIDDYDSKVKAFEEKVSYLKEQTKIKTEKQYKDKENAKQSEEKRKEESIKERTSLSSTEQRKAKRILGKINRDSSYKPNKEEKQLINDFIRLYPKQAQSMGINIEQYQNKEEKVDKSKENSITKEQEKINEKYEFKPSKDMPFTINDDGTVTLHLFNNEGKETGTRKYRKNNNVLEEETDIGWGRSTEDKYNASNVLDDIDSYRAKIEEIRDNLQKQKEEDIEKKDIEEGNTDTIFGRVFKTVNDFLFGTDEEKKDLYNKIITEYVKPSESEKELGLDILYAPDKSRKGKSIQQWIAKQQQKGYSNETILKALQINDKRYRFKDGKFYIEVDNTPRKEKRKQQQKKNVNDIQTNAKGIRQVEKGGLTFISPGEAIIPANMNPFNPDRDKVNIKQQLHEEKNMKSRIIDKINNASHRAEGSPGILETLGFAKDQLKADIQDRFGNLFHDGKLDITGLKPSELAPLLQLFISDSLAQGKKYKDELQPFLDLFGIKDRDIIGYTDKKIKKAISKIGEKAPDSKYYMDAIIQSLIRSDLFQNLDEEKKQFIRERIKNYGYSYDLPSDSQVRSEKIASQTGPLGFINQFADAAFGIDSGKAKDITTEYVTKNLGTAMGGAGIGTLLSAVLPLGGPLFGAIAGAAAGLIANNKTLNEYVFGKEVVDPNTGRISREEGLLPPTMVEYIQKYGPDFKKYGITGSLLGLVTPLGPLGGMMVGAGLSILKNNESMQNFLFGDATGLLNKDRKEFLKKAFPNIAAGTLGMLLLGPSGVVVNAALGAGLGLLSTTEGFKEIVLGTKDRFGVRRGGIAGTIRTEITDPLKQSVKTMADESKKWFRDRILTPVGRAMVSTTKLFSHLARAGFDYLTTSISDKIRDTWVQRIFGFGTQAIRKIGSGVKNVVKLPFKGFGLLSSGLFNGIANVSDRLLYNQGLLSGSAADQIRYAKEHGINDGTILSVNQYLAGQNDNDIAQLGVTGRLLKMAAKGGKVEQEIAHNIGSRKKEFGAEIYRAIEEAGVGTEFGSRRRASLVNKLTEMATSEMGKVNILRELDKDDYSNLPVKVKDKIKELAEEYAPEIQKANSFKIAFNRGNNHGMKELVSDIAKTLHITDDQVFKNINSISNLLINEDKMRAQKAQDEEIEGSGQTELEYKLKSLENETASLELERQSSTYLRDMNEKLGTLVTFFATGGQLNLFPNMNKGTIRDINTLRAIQQGAEIGDIAYKASKGKITSKKDAEAQAIVDYLDSTEAFGAIGIGTIRELTENRTTENLTKLNILYNLADKSKEHGAYIDDADILMKLPMETIERVSILTGYGYNIPESQYDALGKLNKDTFNTVIELAKLGVKFGSFEKFLRVQESNSSEAVTSWMLELAKVKLNDGKTVKDYMTADSMIDNLLSRNSLFMNTFVHGYKTIQQGFDQTSYKYNKQGISLVDDILGELSDNDLDEDETMHVSDDYQGYNGKNITSGSKISAILSKGTDVSKKLANYALFGAAANTMDKLSNSVISLVRFSFPGWLTSYQLTELKEWVKEICYADKDHRKELYDAATDQLLSNFISTSGLFAVLFHGLADKGKDKIIDSIKNKTWNAARSVIEVFVEDADKFVDKFKISAEDATQQIVEELERKYQADKEKYDQLRREYIDKGYIPEDTDIYDFVNRKNSIDTEIEKKRQKEQQEEVAETSDIPQHAEGTTGVKDESGKPTSITDAFVDSVAKKIDPNTKDNKQAPQNSIEKEQERVKETDETINTQQIEDTIKGVVKNIKVNESGDKEVETDYGVLVYTTTGKGPNKKYILAQTKSNTEIIKKIKQRDDLANDSVSLLNRIANAIENKDFGNGAGKVAKKALSGGIFGIFKDMLNIIPNMLDMLIPGLGSTVLKGGLGLLMSGVTGAIGYGFTKFLGTKVGSKLKGLAGKINDTKLGGAIFRRLGLDKKFGLDNPEATLVEQQLDEQRKTNETLDRIEKNTRGGSASTSSSDSGVDIPSNDSDDNKKDSDKKDNDKNGKDNKDDNKKDTNKKNNGKGKWYDRLFRNNGNRIKTGAKIITGLGLATAAGYGIHHYASQAGNNDEGMFETGARNLYNSNIVSQDNAALNLMMKDHTFNPEPYRDQFNQVGGMLSAFEWNLADKLKQNGVSDDQIATSIINQRKNNNNQPIEGNSITNDAQNYATNTYNNITNNAFDYGASMLMSTVSGALLNAGGSKGLLKNSLLSTIPSFAYNVYSSTENGEEITPLGLLGSLATSAAIGTGSNYLIDKFRNNIWYLTESDQEKTAREERERLANGGKTDLEVNHPRTAKALDKSKNTARKIWQNKYSRNALKLGALGAVGYGIYDNFLRNDNTGSITSQPTEFRNYDPNNNTSSDQPIVQNDLLGLGLSMALPSIGSAVAGKLGGGVKSRIAGSLGGSLLSDYLTTGEIGPESIISTAAETGLGLLGDYGIFNRKDVDERAKEDEEYDKFLEEKNKAKEYSEQKESERKEEVKKNVNKLQTNTVDKLGKMSDEELKALASNPTSRMGYKTVISSIYTDGVYDQLSDDQKKAIDRYRNAIPEDSNSITKAIEEHERKNTVKDDETPQSPPNKDTNSEADKQEKKNTDVDKTKPVSNTKDIDNKKGTKLTGKTKEIFQNLLGKLKEGCSAVLQKCAKYIPGKKSKDAVSNFFKVLIQRCKSPKCIGKVVKYAARFLSVASPVALAGLVLNVGMIIYDFLDGYNSADKILGLPAGSASMGMKAVAGIINALVGATPLSIFMDTEEIVKLAIEYVGPVFGFTQQDLDRMAREAEQKTKEDNQPTSFTQDVGKILSDTYESAKDTVLNGPARLKNYLVDKWNSFTDWVSNNASYLKNTVIDTAVSAKNWVVDKWNKGTDMIANEAQYLKNIFMPDQEELNKRMGKGKHSIYGTGAFFSQLDPRFNMSFNAKGDTIHQTMYDSGCGPMAAANALSSLGIPDDPTVGAKFALSKYKEKNGGTKPEFFTDYMKQKGVPSQRLYNNKDIKESLKSGKPVILMGKDPSGETSRTPYAENPHYVTATGLDSKGNIIIQDPESMTPNKIYKASEVLSKSNIAIGTGMGKHSLLPIHYPVYGKGSTYYRTITAPIFGMGSNVSIDKMWALANWASEKCKVDPKFIFGQWYHESGAFTSQLAVENYNFGGMTQSEPTGDPADKQPPRDGNNYYMHFANPEEWAEYYAWYINRCPGVAGSNSVENFAQALKDNGYYGASISEYINGINGGIQAIPSGKPRMELIDQNNFGKRDPGQPTKFNGNSSSSSSSGSKNGGLLGTIANITKIMSDAVNPFSAFTPTSDTSTTTTNANNAGWDSILETDMAQKRMTPQQKIDNMVQESKDIGKTNVSSEQIAKDILTDGKSTQGNSITNSTVGEGKYKFGRGVAGVVADMAKDVAVDTATSLATDAVTNALTNNEDQEKQEENKEQENKSNTTSTSSGGMFGYLEDYANKIASPLKQSMGRIGKALMGAVSTGPMASAIKLFFGDNNPFLSMFGGNQESGNNNNNKQLTNQNIKVAGNPIDTLLGAIPGTVVTSTYMTEDGRPTPGPHGGIDIGGDEGTPIPSPISGKVVALGSGDGGGYGHYIQIQDSKGNYHMIGHCQDQYVSVGQEVKPGDVIGTIGQTGYSTGPHIHYEIDPPENFNALKDGPHIDPYTYGAGKHIRNVFGRGLNPIEDIPTDIEPLSNIPDIFKENKLVPDDIDITPKYNFGTGNIFSNILNTAEDMYKVYKKIRDIQNKPIKEHNEKNNKEQSTNNTIDETKQTTPTETNTKPIENNDSKLDALLSAQLKTNELISSSNTLLSKLVELTVEVIKSSNTTQKEITNVNTKQKTTLDSIAIQLSKIGNGSRYGIGDKFITSKAGEVESIVGTMQAIAAR